MVDIANPAPVHATTNRTTGQPSLACAPRPAWPRVSVIMPSYNYAAYIEQALESVAAQTYPAWSCVIVDDSSSDDSVRIIRDWITARGDNRFQLLETSTNQGELAAIALGLSVAEGEFVALLDSDDYWLPDFIFTHVRAHLNAAITAAVSCSDLILVDERNRMLAATFGARGFSAALQAADNHAIGPERIPDINPIDGLPSLTPSAIFPDVRFVPPDLFRWRWTASSGLMFRRSVLDLMMPDPVPVGRFGADHYMLHACHYAGGSLLIDARLGAYRRHGKNGYSSFPVFAAGAAQAPYNAFSHTEDNFQTLLQHALDRRDSLEEALGGHRISTLVTAIVSHRLSRRLPVTDSRITRQLGKWGMIRAWYYALCPRRSA